MLYVSADEYLARQIVDVFERETGIDVLMVGDTEAQKTTGLVQRLEREADNPQADVFWSSEIFRTIGLAESGVLEEHLSDATVEWPRQWRDPQRRWYGFAARARVLVYHPQRLRPDELPETWMALTRPQWKGRIVMADPRFGTTGGHLAAMKSFWGREFHSDSFYEAFLMGLADNEVRLLPGGNAAAVQAVIDGEADLGMTDTDDVLAARANGAAVEMIYPAHSVERGAEGIGTLLIPNTVGRVRGGPNPEAAKTLIDFLLSPRVERLIAESVSGNMPLGPGAASAAAEPIPEPLDVSFEHAAAQLDRAIEQAMRMLTAAEAAAGDEG